MELRAHLNSVWCPCATLVIEFLSPRFRAHIGYFWSAAATKCVSPRRDGASTWQKAERGKGNSGRLWQSGDILKSVATI